MTEPTPRYYQIGTREDTVLATAGTDVLVDSYNGVIEVWNDGRRAVVVPLSNLDYLLEKDAE
jgi:hypothetical protein